MDASGAVSTVEAKFGNSSGYMGLALNPQFISQISENFIVIGTQFGTYVVRRTDGKSVRIDETPMYNGMGAYMQAPVQADKIGNLYMNTYQQGLFKVALPAELTSDELIKTSLVKGELEQVQQYTVNHDGYLVAVVSAKTPGPGMTARTRLYKPNGSVQNLSTNQYFGGGNMWVAKDGTLYMHTHGPSGTGLHMFSVDSSETGTFVPVEGWSESYHLGMPYMPALLPDQAVLSGIEYSRESNEEHPMGVDIYKSYLMFIKGAQATKEYLTKVYKVSSVSASAKAVVILGTDKDDNTLVSSFDPTTKEEKVLFTDPNYQILKVTVASNGTVTLNALRLSDNTYVVADIKDGALAVASSELPPVQQFLTLQ